MTKGEAEKWKRMALRLHSYAASQATTQETDANNPDAKTWWAVRQAAAEIVGLLEDACSTRKHGVK